MLEKAAKLFEQWLQDLRMRLRTPQDDEAPVEQRVGPLLQSDLQIEGDFGPGLEAPEEGAKRSDLHV